MIERVSFLLEKEMFHKISIAISSSVLQITDVYYMNVCAFVNRKRKKKTRRKKIAFLQELKAQRTFTFTMMTTTTTEEERKKKCAIITSSSSDGGGTHCRPARRKEVARYNRFCIAAKQSLYFL